MTPHEKEIENSEYANFLDINYPLCACTKRKSRVNKIFPPSFHDSDIVEIKNEKYRGRLFNIFAHYEVESVCGSIYWRYKLYDNELILDVNESLIFKSMNR